MGGCCSRRCACQLDDLGEETVNHRFDDITSRIAEPPSWWDSNGTPRYGEFEPRQCPNIYSHAVGMFLIACQACGERFTVEMHADIFDHRLKTPPAKWHYGDPPNHGCVGDTMNCEDIAVLEFWTRDGVEEWERRPEFEGGIYGDE